MEELLEKAEGERGHKAYQRTRLGHLEQIGQKGGVKAAEEAGGAGEHVAKLEKLQADMKASGADPKLLADVQSVIDQWKGASAKEEKDELPKLPGQGKPSEEIKSAAGGKRPLADEVRQETLDKEKAKKTGAEIDEEGDKARKKPPEKKTGAQLDEEREKAGGAPKAKEPAGEYVATEEKAKEKPKKKWGEGDTKAASKERVKEAKAQEKKPAEAGEKPAEKKPGFEEAVAGVEKKPEQKIPAKGTVTKERAEGAKPKEKKKPSQKLSDVVPDEAQQKVIEESISKVLASKQTVLQLKDQISKEEAFQEQNMQETIRPTFTKLDNQAAEIDKFKSVLQTSDGANVVLTNWQQESNEYKDLFEKLFEKADAITQKWITEIKEAQKRVSTRERLYVQKALADMLELLEKAGIAPKKKPPKIVPDNKPGTASNGGGDKGKPGEKPGLTYRKTVHEHFGSGEKGTAFPNRKAAPEDDDSRMLQDDGVNPTTKQPDKLKGANLMNNKSGLAAPAGTPAGAAPANGAPAPNGAPQNGAPGVNGNGEVDENDPAQVILRNFQKLAALGDRELQALRPLFVGTEAEYTGEPAEGGEVAPEGEEEQQPDAAVQIKKAWMDLLKAEFVDLVKAASEVRTHMMRTKTGKLAVRERHQRQIPESAAVKIDFSQLTSKIIDNVSRLHNEVQFVEMTGTADDFILEFDSSRFGGLFTPRPGEEDDDYPNFTGRNRVGDAVKAVVGEGYKISVWDHEKGMFSVGVKKIGIPKAGEPYVAYKKLTLAEKQRKARLRSEIIGRGRKVAEDPTTQSSFMEYGGFVYNVPPFGGFVTNEGTLAEFQKKMAAGSYRKDIKLVSPDAAGAPLEFDPKKMEALIAEDAFLQNVARRGAKPEVIFNTYVLGDSVMERRYSGKLGIPKVEETKEKWSAMKDVLREKVKRGEIKSTRDIQAERERLQSLTPEEFEKEQAALVTEGTIYGRKIIGVQRDAAGNPLPGSYIVEEEKEKYGLEDSITAGDRVTIVDRFGKEHTGRAVMRGPAGWVLNMGGAHGTPAIASDENITRVKKTKTSGRTPISGEPEQAYNPANYDIGDKVMFAIKTGGSKRTGKIKDFQMSNDPTGESAIIDVGGGQTAIIGLSKLYPLRFSSLTKAADPDSEHKRPHWFRDPTHEEDEAIAARREQEKKEGEKKQTWMHGGHVAHRRIAKSKRSFFLKKDFSSTGRSDPNADVTVGNKIKEEDEDKGKRPSSKGFFNWAQMKDNRKDDTMGIYNEKNPAGKAPKGLLNTKDAALKTQGGFSKSEAEVGRKGSGRAVDSASFGSEKRQNKKVMRGEKSPGVAAAIGDPNAAGQM